MTAAPTTLTVAEFIEPRLDEDEAAARAADAPPNGVGDFRSRCHENLGGWPVAMADHIARHDPARVLAQVAATRKVVELHAEKAPGVCSVCSAHDFPCPTLRALASIWRGADGWREEWA